MEVRPQRLGQEPRGDVEVFVVRLGQLAAAGAGLVERGRDLGNAIAGGQRSPAAGQQLFLFSARCFPIAQLPPFMAWPQGTMAVLISVERFISFSKTRLSS